jgi:hypothetical protein
MPEEHMPRPPRRLRGFWYLVRGYGLALFAPIEPHRSLALSRSTSGAAHGLDLPVTSSPIGPVLKRDCGSAS